MAVNADADANAALVLSRASFRRFGGLGAAGFWDFADAGVGGSGEGAGAEDGLFEVGGARGEKLPARLAVSEDRDGADFGEHFA